MEIPQKTEAPGGADNTGMGFLSPFNPLTVSIELLALLLIWVKKRYWEGGRSTEGVTRFRREAPSAPLNPPLAGLCIEMAINIAGQKMLRPHLSSRPQEHVCGKEEGIEEGFKERFEVIWGGVVSYCSC